MVPLVSSSGQHFRLSLRKYCRQLWLALVMVPSFLMFPLVVTAGAVEPAAGGPGKPATAVAFAPTGEGIVTGNEDGILAVWERQSGKIVTITSINGKRGKLGQANYAASKAGIIGLTKTCARDLGKFSINVNAVAPGLIETDMMAQAPQSVKDLALSEILLGRLGKPEEVANVVCFLASDLARHVTGQVLNVDGGQFLG